MKKKQILCTSFRNMEVHFSPSVLFDKNSYKWQPVIDSATIDTNEKIPFPYVKFTHQTSFCVCVHSLTGMDVRGGWW